MMRCPSVSELPPPPDGKEGWPWTEETSPASTTPVDQPVTEIQDDSSWPSFSIVTPSYSQGPFIEETIRSVLLQGYPGIEYIIVDGGSLDESVRVIRKYARWLKIWISEPDRGQSHAINKGLRHCEGDIFNWINSDDLLVPGALHAVARAWKKTPNAIISGRVINFDEEGNECLVKPNGLSLRNFINVIEARKNRMVWHQPGTFLSRAQVVDVGGVQEDLIFNMDHFLMIDLLRVCDVVYISDVLARFRLHNNSKTLSNGFLQFRLERVRKLRESELASGFVTVTELKQEQVSLLLACADMERKASLMRYWPHLVEALAVAPTLTIVALIRRSYFGRLARVVKSKARKLFPVSRE